MPSVIAYFEFEVSLEEIKPRIWRQFRLRKDSTFYELHDTIQKACGWQNYHLFDFHPVGSQERLAVSPYDDPWDENDVAPVAGAIRVDSFFHNAGDKCIYAYDYGDDWRHLVELKGVERLPSDGRRKLIGGERAFPPEDCGSIGGAGLRPEGHHRVGNGSGPRSWRVRRHSGGVSFCSLALLSPFR